MAELLLPELRRANRVGWSRFSMDEAGHSQMQARRDMSEMIERVARAIIQAMPYTGDGPDDPKIDYPSVARAAIEAMREPTEDMQFAGVKMLSPESGMDAARDAFNAMIDAAHSPREAAMTEDMTPEERTRIARGLKKEATRIFLDLVTALPMDEMEIEHLRACGWPEVAEEIEWLCALLEHARVALTDDAALTTGKRDAK